MTAAGKNARVTHESAKPSTPEHGLVRRVLASTDKLMVVEHEMQVGWEGARHSHPHEQAVYVVSGRLKFSMGGETFEVKKGDSLVVEGGVEHQAWALEPSVVIDVFTPTRDDYR